MPQISVWPEEVVVPFDGEVNLLEALVAAGLPIAHLCGGKARCSTCRVAIVEGLADLSERTEAEAAMATRLDFPDLVRLACQTTASASVRLRRLVLDKQDVELASQLGKPKFVGPIGKEVHVAVMFVDVVGYTTMAEALPAYDIVHLLNRFFTRADSIVEDNAGRVDNYMGDAFLALFGIDDDPYPALSAVRCGIGVLELAEDLTRYIEIIYHQTFKVRVGIDFGEVVYGLMGAESSARETVIGDTVNVASRLESANKDTGTEILVSDAVFEEARDEVEFGRRFELDIRGKAGRVIAHEVLGLSAPPKDGP